MKKITLFALLVSSLAAYGQKINLTPSYSIGFGQKEACLKNAFNLNFGISYEWNDRVGMSLQTCKESWSVSSRENTNVTLQATSVQFYLHQPLDRINDWTLIYSAGVLAGFGTPIGDNAADLQLLRHQYFAGVSLEAGVSKKLSEKISLTTFIKLDAIAGAITNRPVSYENFTANSSLFVGLKLGYFLK